MTYAPKPFVVTESGDTETAPDVAQPIALFGVEASGGGGVDLPLGTDDIELQGFTGQYESLNGFGMNAHLMSNAENLSGLVDVIMAHNTQIEDLEGVVQDKPDLPISSYEVTAEQFDSSLYVVLNQLNTQLSTLQVEKADLPVNSDDVDLDGTTLTSALSDLASSFQDEMDDLRTDLEDYADAAAQAVAFEKGEVTNYNDATEPGMYSATGTGSQNRPPGQVARGVIIVTESGGQIIQFATLANSSLMMWKRHYNGTTWTAWAPEGAARSTETNVNLQPGWENATGRQTATCRREGDVVSFTAALNRGEGAFDWIATIGNGWRPEARVDIVALYGDDMTPHLAWIQPDGELHCPDAAPHGTRVVINTTWPAAD